MRIATPDELSAFLLAARLGRERCRVDEESDGTWYVDYKRPPTPRHVAELVAAVRCWLAEERIERTIVWIEEQPLPLTRELHRRRLI
jgi:hypothetical protein